MQLTSQILMVRPAAFSFNEETAASNTFQNKISIDDETLLQSVIQEFDVFVETLRQHGIIVTVIEDTAYPKKPDAIFPNNWVSFHENGTVIFYPMHAPNRRTERRMDVIDDLRDRFEISEIIDFSFYENENRFLEGTGSICFDHVNRVAYAALSPRTDKELFEKLCKKIGYKPFSFQAHDRAGTEIYHTNVMMCMGEKFAVICAESILNQQERNHLLQNLENTGHEIIDIDYQQMVAFAGNMLVVKNVQNENLLILSQSAFDSLSAKQKLRLGKYAQLLPVQIKTIESIAGGSARCMMAEIFLPPKK